MTDRWWLKCPKCGEYFFTADWSDEGMKRETCEKCKTKLKIYFVPKVEIDTVNVILDKGDKIDEQERKDNKRKEGL